MWAGGDEYNFAAKIDKKDEATVRMDEIEQTLPPVVLSEVRRV